jgi:hypothetical protein
MVRELKTLAPETSVACDTIETLLSPAIESIRASVRITDAAAFSKSADQYRIAISRVQEELRRAQGEFIDRDPLIAARWFARAAETALREKPPDFLLARKQQGNASEALTRAWNSAVRQAAVNRFASIPGIAPLFDPWLSDSLHTLNDPSAVRDWRRLRELNMQTNASSHEQDPPEYREAIRAYFQALNRTDDAPAKK